MYLAASHQDADKALCQTKLKRKSYYYGLKKVKPQICSCMYLVFENITMLLWFELLNHCIPNLHWLLPAAYAIQKEIWDFENCNKILVPREILVPLTISINGRLDMTHLRF